MLSKTKIFETINSLETWHYIMFLVFLLVATCTIKKRKLDSERSKQQEKIALVKEINRKKLNYVTYLSLGWQDYHPNLIGAEGWIITNCGHYPEKEILGDKIIVDSMDLSDTGWGNYDGRLYGRYLKNNLTTTIMYKCFEPDYKIGDWDFISIYDIE